MNNKAFLAGLFLHIVYIITVVYPQTNHLRAIYLFNDPLYTWNTAANHCHAYNGHLLYIDGDVIMNIFKYYTTAPQAYSSWNYQNAWIGLFKSNVNTLQLKWQSVCVPMDINDIQNWEAGTPALDVNKNCVYMGTSMYSYNFENCDQKLRVVCERTEGACSFEQKSFYKPIALSANYSAYGQYVASLDSCECLCQQALLVNQVECWAVTYNHLTQFCQPYMGLNPFEFEQLTSDVTYTTSYKRCFRMQFYSVQIPDYYLVEPHEKCFASNSRPNMASCTIEPTTTTVMSTTTMATSTTTPFTTTTTTVSTTATSTPTTTTTTVSTTATSTPTTTTTTVSTTTTSTPTTTTTTVSTTATSTPTTTTTTVIPTITTTTVSTTTTSITTVITTSTLTSTTTSLPTTTTTSTTTAINTPTATITTTSTPATTTTAITTITTFTTSTAEITTSTTSSTTTLLPNAPRCSCTCVEINDNKTEEEIIIELISRMTLDPKGMTSFIRKKTCAEDDRPSAQTLGMVGILLLALLPGILIFLDFMNIVHMFRSINKLLQT